MIRVKIPKPKFSVGDELTSRYGYPCTISGYPQLESREVSILGIVEEIIYDYHYPVMIKYPDETKVYEISEQDLITEYTKKEKEQ